MNATFYIAATTLLILNSLSLLGTLLGLPGNWLMVLLTGGFAWLFPIHGNIGIAWPMVGVLLVMAAIGEVVEFVAGAAGAARQGASRRSVTMSVMGALLGTGAGALVGIPIPVVGSLVAALIGGAVGSFLGAYAGEMWSGTTHHQGWRSGQAAFWGRLWGTAGKVLVGSLMLVVATAASFF